MWACGVASSYPHPGSIMQEDGKDVADGGFGSGRDRIVKGAGGSTPENPHRLSQFPHSPPDGAWWCLESPGRRNGGLQAAAVGNAWRLEMFHGPFTIHSWHRNTTPTSPSANTHQLLPTPPPQIGSSQTGPSRIGSSHTICPCKAVRTTLNTAISWFSRSADAVVPVPFRPLYSSVHENIPGPRPGTSEKLTVSVSAPSAATRPTTTPSERGPAKNLYNFPDTGPGWPVGVNVVAAQPGGSWLMARMPCSC